MKHALSSTVFFGLMGTACQALTITFPVATVGEPGWWSRGDHLIRWEDYDASKTLDISLTSPNSTTKQTILNDIPADQGVAVFTSPHHLADGDYIISFSVKPNGEDEASNFSVWHGIEPPLDEDVKWSVYGQAADDDTGGWGDDSAASPGISKGMIPYVLSFAGLALGVHAFF
ncbi:hypothetical protein L198_04626 [Cryptococcus wingfieldii CBS 7118]|uniref:Uncharacterized protein n=1 Tax=Cryptococcus wingfieldii CBS 7118 TaxID=1295528 RepID=A0A1E3J304_9TREE|nr:hypothetical protein L198_04626 [Cryptococcus wingfieldii CBS 7118]ODN95238.1 hypothetical protein L198_04626 [Cryptococcus wingfieldii CBS 7118]